MVGKETTQGSGNDVIDLSGGGGVDLPARLPMVNGQPSLTLCHVENLLHERPESPERLPPRADDLQFCSASRRIALGSWITDARQRGSLGPQLTLEKIIGTHQRRRVMARRFWIPKRQPSQRPLLSRAVGQVTSHQRNRHTSTPPPSTTA